MKKYIYLFLSALSTAVIAGTLSASMVQADTCNTQYGTTTCVPKDLTIDKKVRNPITGEFVDNLLSGDAAYSTGVEAIYKLKITNTSTQDFSDVEVKDILPEKLTHASVAESDKDKIKDESFADQKLTFHLKDTLKAGQSIEIEVHSRITDAGTFTKDLSCGNSDGLQNSGEVRASDRFDQDSAQICVEKKVMGVTTLPSAGVTDVLPLLPFIGMGATGVALFLKRQRPACPPKL